MHVFLSQENIVGWNYIHTYKDSDLQEILANIFTCYESKLVHP